MLKEHLVVQGLIAKAEQAARELYAKGCRVENTIRSLNRASSEVAERIKTYRQAGGEKEKSAEEPKSPEPVKAAAARAAGKAKGAANAEH